MILSREEEMLKSLKIHIELLKGIGQEIVLRYWEGKQALNYLRTQVTQGTFKKKGRFQAPVMILRIKENLQKVPLNPQINQDSQQVPIVRMVGYHVLKV